MSAFLTVMLIFVCLFAAMASADAAGAWASYFRDQLSADARVFYDAMVKMYEDGTLKTGAESLDLTEAGFLSQEKVAAYMNEMNLSASGLLADFGAARDAFWADYPSVFYVDFSNLSIRVTTDASDRYHVYIGAGRTENYFTQGFASRAQVEAAISEYNAALSAIVSGARKATPRVGQSAEAAQVEYVHDALTRSVSYRLEDACQPANRGLIRTAYGALVKHEGVCEAYTRAFKAAMDALGIPCVMVSGVYLHNADMPEAHIWDYVLLDGAWYGVDATMDDPRPPKGKSTLNSAGLDGYESHEYLLRGAVGMGQKHVPSGIMSPANYEFGYPSLAQEDYGVEVITRDDGFSVTFKQDGLTDDGEAAGEFFISYRGMGCAAARSAGYWFIERFWNQNSDGELVPDQWHYILTDVYNLDDHETYLHLSYPQVAFVEFAVTEVAPGPYLEDPFTYMWYVGNPGHIGPQSGMIYNANSGYKAPPYPRTVTPAMNVKIEANGKPFHVSVEYNDDLTLTSQDAVIGVDMTAYGYNPDRSIRPVHGIDQRAQITNVQWDGGRCVTFDFLPSPYFADTEIIYRLSLTGLVGISSGKTPVEISYGVAQQGSFCPLGVGGFNWRVFALPSLVDNSDLSMSGWEMADGTIPSELLASRLTLVTSSTSPAQTDDMNGLISDTGEKVLSSQTYNINLTLCKGNIARLADGHSLRISVGFPEGYGPDDAGVTFKAYHFMKDADGNVTGVEEIPCTVTRYGLIIECYSFSPFAIAAVQGSSATHERGVILTGTTGGSITSGRGGIFTLSRGEIAAVTVRADAGRVIETLTVGGSPVAGAVGQSSYQLTLAYDALAAVSDNIVNATFVASAVHQTDVKNGETAQALPPSGIHEHTWGGYSADAASHYRVCVECGAAEARALHTGGTATCVYLARCEVCGVSYGDRDPQAHGQATVRNAVPATEATEGYTGDTCCADCGTVLESGSPIPKLTHTHQFSTRNADDSSHWMECSCGARDGSAAHTFGPYTSTAASHTHACLDCGHRVTDHHLPNPDDLNCSTPTTCAICGYVIDEAHEHTWGPWTSEGSYHVSRCLNESCAAETRAAHTGGTATCGSPAVCDVCCLPYGGVNPGNHAGGTVLRGYVAPTESAAGYTGDMHCLGCGQMLEKGNALAKLPPRHEHDFQMRFDGTGHWYECACGVRWVGSYTAHDDNGYIETAAGHARRCAACGYTSPVEIHVPGDNNDCETPVYCTVCLYEMAPARAHRFGGVLFSDAYGHWHVCLNAGCTQTDGKTAHSGGTATCVKLAVCQDCFTPYGEPDPEHHVSTELRGYREATETQSGYTGDVYCTDCGACVSRGSVILAPAEAPDVPQTGDNSHILFWFALMILSGAAACLCLWIGRRGKYE